MAPYGISSITYPPKYTFLPSPLTFRDQCQLKNPAADSPDDRTCQRFDDADQASMLEFMNEVTVRMTDGGEQVKVKNNGSGKVRE